MTIALATIGILAGLALFAGGALASFGGMMSDAPADGERLARNGCIAVVAGLAVFAASIAALVL